MDGWRLWLSSCGRVFLPAVAAAAAACCYRISRAKTMCGSRSCVCVLNTRDENKLCLAPWHIVFLSARCCNPVHYFIVLGIRRWRFYDCSRFGTREMMFSSESTGLGPSVRFLLLRSFGLFVLCMLFALDWNAVDVDCNGCVFHPFIITLLERVFKLFCR